MAQPLTGVRVVELAQGVQGPYAAKMFADHGADVVKVEPPGGDVARAAGPFPDDQPHPEQSALFLHLNTNKRSVTLDPSLAEGREVLRQLVKTADIVIESYRPGTLETWGLGFEALRELRPRLVLTSVTPFGQDGPYAGFKGEEIVYYAMGGPMQATGLIEREPVKLAGSVISYQCGTLAAAATMAAFMTASGPDGEAVHVDVSNFESQAASIDRRLTNQVAHSYNGDDGERAATQRFGPLPTGIYPVTDGYVQIITIPAWMPRMLATLDDDELRAAYDRPDWMAHGELGDAADGVLYPWLLERTRAQAMADAQANRWPVTALNAPIDVLGDEHFGGRGTFVEVDHPAAGRFRQLGAPFRMEDGWQLRRPAPLLGEHTAEVYGELGIDEQALAGLRAAGAV
jgi:crotonobetainyl-CoA:carnitine CoA-transferase CaiB-like acyl-CoA transferase